MADKEFPADGEMPWWANLWRRTLLPESLKSLVRTSGQKSALAIAAVLGTIVGLSVPVIALMLGALLRCLIAAQMQQTPQSIPGPSRFLPDVQSWLPDGLSTLSQFTYLLSATAVVVIVTALLLLLLYRQTQVVAVKLETALVQRLRKHARALATTRTLSAQQLALTDCLDYHLPRARSVLARWWRAFPRHVVQAACCLLVMLLVQPMLLVLTVVATSLVYLVFRLYDRVRRSALPVVRERAGHLRGEMIDECISGPLRSFSQPDGKAERFGEQLAIYERDAVRSLTSSAWKTPAILVASAVIVGIFLFLIAVQILSSDTSFTVPGAFAFTLCFIGAAVSVERLQRGIRDLKSVAPAADSLQHFLSLPVETYDAENLQKIERISSGIELDHVTVQDSSGRKLLENVSAHIKPGQLIGVVATQPLEARALVELLMGFGRPVSGRLLFDGKPVTDLDPKSIADAAHWVAPSGAIATGTLRENIITKPAAIERLDDIVRQTRLLETVQRLPDSLNTLITPDDDRLRGDDGFRIGLARGAASGASVVVVDEPKRIYDAEGEKTTLEGIRSLVSDRAITVVLPQRLLTLRSCDAVVMLSEHTVADVGSHSELLQRNEYYRHLNYLRFNPYQSVQ